MSEEKQKLGISKHFPSLVRLSEIVDTTTDTLKECLQQISKGGVSKDKAILESMKRPPFLDILGLLESLQQEISARQMSKDTVVEPLGLRDKQVVKHSMDLFVLFEIMPRLLPSLGTKLEHRMERSEVAGFLGQLQSRQGFDWQPNREQIDLGQIVCRMVQIIEKADLLAGIMRDKYTTDILASLLQTAYAPIPPSKDKMTLRALRESNYYVEMEEGRRIELRKMFSRLYDSTNTHQLLESLTTLLNNVVSCQRPIKWIETLCGRFLSRIVAQRPHGARITVDYLVANDEDLTAAKMDRIANMLLNAPGGMPMEEYLAKIVPQIIRMAAPQKIEEDVVDSMMDKQAVEERVEQVSVYALKQLADQHPKRFGELVAVPLNKPLAKWFQTREGVDTKGKVPLIQDITEPIVTAPDNDGVVASAMDLKRALGFIERLVLTGGGVPSSALLEELVVPVFAPLISWFASKDASRETVQDILVTTLRLLPLPDAISAVFQTICTVRGNENSECPVFESSRLVWHKANTGAVDVEAMLDVLSSHKLSQVIGDIFLALLQRQQTSLELLQSLRHHDSGVESAETQLGQWWLLSQTTLAMSERFGAKVLTKQVDVLVFVLGALQRANEAVKEQAEDVSIEELMGSARASKDKEDADTEVGEMEMAVLALMMLSQMMAAGEQQAFAGLMSGQQDADRVEWDSRSVELLRRIRDIIRELQTRRLDPAIGQLVDELSPQIVLVLALQGDKAALSAMGETSAVEDSPAARFEAALRDTRNELIPVQAHGLIELRHLVLEKSPVLEESPERMDSIIHAFVRNVKHQDSYVYLNAIRGLSSLADAEGRRFIPMLMEMYQKTLELDEWLRVGEALLQSVTRAGLMLGEYADVVVPPLISIVRGNKSPEESFGVQAHSALSILGAIAQACPLALHRWIDEISVELNQNILLWASDQAALRRSAVVFWVSLLRGYSNRLLELISGETVRDVYRTLKLVADGDPDDMARTHAEVGLAELDQLLKTQLFAKPNIL